MASLGVLLLVLGVGSLLLPMFDIQFQIMTIVDPYQPFAGVVVAAVGAALIALALQRRRTAATPAPTNATES
ncbi:MAG TPA: hypothetical protein VFT20_01270 [Candidatus Limnocylindrales bacterium]|nr:hypothetical protein [Candidatus Limnocylindrales bacterium]